MKFTCTKENLNKALSLVSPLANKVGHLPILMNILINAGDGGVELVSTNLEIAVKTSLRAKVDGKGAFTVPAKTLFDYVNLLPEGQVEIALKDNELLIKSGSSSTKIKGMPAEEFPVVPGVEEEKVFVLDAAALKKALSETVIATAKNEIRPELSGLFMSFNKKDGELVLAATDSYRLAEARLKIIQGDEKTEAIVPARTVYEIIRLIGVSRELDKEKNIRVWISENQIAARYDNFEMTSRLIAGKYPDYEQIVPAEFKSRAVFPAEVVVKNIKAASLFTTAGINAVVFDLNSDTNILAISSTSAQTGEHNSEIDAEIEGEENSILLNHRYVLDGLAQINGEVIFGVNSSDAPCLFRPKENNNFLYIVMPIRQ